MCAGKVINLPKEYPRTHRQIDRWAAYRAFARYHIPHGSSDFARILGDRKKHHEELELKGVPWLSREEDEQLMIDELLDQYLTPQDRRQVELESREG